MKIQIRLFRNDSPDSGGGLLSGLTPIGLGLGALQTGIGIVQDIKAKKKINTLLDQQKAYQTPSPIFDILHATQANAGKGYDATTLNYLNNQTDQAFSSGIDASLKVGGDPNDLSSLFAQKINAIMKIGSDNHVANMANFSQYLSALNNVADNNAAEQKSQQDLIKNKLQAAGVQMQSGTGNISGGLNTLLSTLSAQQLANLYKIPSAGDGQAYSTNNTTGYVPDLISASSYAAQATLPAFRQPNFSVAGGQPNLYQSESR